MQLSNIKVNEIRFSASDIEKLRNALQDLEDTGEQQVIEFVQLEGKNEDKEVSYIVVLEAETLLETE